MRLSETALIHGYKGITHSGELISVVRDKTYYWGYVGAFYNVHRENADRIYADDAYTHKRQEVELDGRRKRNGNVKISADIDMWEADLREGW